MVQNYVVTMLTRSGVDTPANREQFNLLYSVWTGLVKDLYPDLVPVLRDYGMEWGAVSLISACSDIADNAIHYSDQLGRVIIDTTVLPEHVVPLALRIIDILDAREGLYLRDLKPVLQVLRFPKRFTFVDNQQAKAVSLQKFRNTNLRCMHRSVNPHNQTYISLVSMIKDEVAEILVGYQLDESDCYFSNGSTYEGCKTIADKVSAYGKVSPCMAGVPIPGGYWGWPERSCRVIAVPKNYKSYRIIAPETAYSNYVGSMIRAALRRCFKRNDVPITVETQEESVEMCRLGALDGRTSTIDLSSASDSITYQLAMLVLPEPFRSDIMSVRPTVVSIPGKGRKVTQSPCWIFLTSGNPCTWDAESMIFLSVVRACYKMYSHLTHDEELVQPAVYGDDLIVDTKVFDLVCEILEFLDFTVNTEKSFSGNYRESCGAEFALNYDTRSVYWPRRCCLEWINTLQVAPYLDHKPLWKVFRENISNPSVVKDLGGLIALQHEVYEYPTARNCLEDFILKCFPRMTYHDPGTNCADLWGLRLPRYTNAPYEGEVPGNLMAAYPMAFKREIHWCLASKGLPRTELDEVYLYSQFLSKGPIEADDIPAFYWIDGVRHCPTVRREITDSDSLQSAFSRE